MASLMDLSEWTKASGIRLDGIVARKIPGSGIGLVATRDLQAGERILTVPITVVRTILTVPKHIRDLENCSVAGRLAADLALDAASSLQPWRATLPTKDAFQNSMPIFWPDEVQMLLPPASMVLLEAMKGRFEKDWTMISTTVPQLSREEFLYYWLLVSSRTFYFTSSQVKDQDLLESIDRLAIVPYADYFNHADSGCDVSYSDTEYRIVTDREIPGGQELFISYGSHNNDFLLVEYGFLLDQNPFDEVLLDEFTLPMFSESQKKVLEEAGYLGKYSLNVEAVCYRTQAALRILLMPTKEWLYGVQQGFDEDDEHKPSIDKRLLGMYREYLELANRRLPETASNNRLSPSQSDSLIKRWTQLCRILEAGIRRLQDDCAPPISK